MEYYRNRQKKLNRTDPQNEELGFPDHFDDDAIRYISYLLPGGVLFVAQLRAERYGILSTFQMLEVFFQKEFWKILLMFFVLSSKDNRDFWLLELRISLVPMYSLRDHKKVNFLFSLRLKTTTYERDSLLLYFFVRFWNEEAILSGGYLLRWMNEISKFLGILVLLTKDAYSKIFDETSNILNSHILGLKLLGGSEILHLNFDLFLFSEFPLLFLRQFVVVRRIFLNVRT